MNIQIREKNGLQCAVINSTEKIIFDEQSALDLMMTVLGESGCRRIAVKQEAVVEDFFILSTRLAGEILQKFVNYHFKLAVIGDFSKYSSKPLRDFIYESNKGNDIFFVATEAEAIQKLSRV